MNILFVCRYNRFRSKIAEGFFNKFNLNKMNKAKSAGLIKGNFINRGIFKAAKQFGIKIVGEPRGLSSKLLEW